MSTEISSLIEATTEVLIADSCDFSRKKLKSILVDVGASAENIYETSTASQAEIILEKKNVQIIFSEERLDDCEVVNFSRLVSQYRKSCLKFFILTSTNCKKDDVLKYAFEEIDMYLQKPINLKLISDILYELFSQKKSLAAYWEQVDRGTKFLEENINNCARNCFVNALSLSPEPIMAYYNLGRIDLAENKPSGAVLNFKKALEYNPYHYNSLKSLYETYKELNLFSEAFEVGITLAGSFPLSTEEFGDVIRLCVRTKNFNYIFFFCNLVKDVQKKDRELLNYLGAGLIIAGEYRLDEGQIGAGVECFKKIIEFCSTFPKFIKKFFHILARHRLFANAENLLIKIRRDDPNFKIYHFLVLSEKSHDPNIVIDEGIRLFLETGDESLRLILESVSQKTGRSLGELEEIKNLSKLKAG